MRRAHARTLAILLVVATVLAGCAPFPPVSQPVGTTAPLDDKKPGIAISQVADYMESQRDAMATALRTERGQDEAEIRVLPHHALLVRLSSDALFHIASAEVRPEGRVTLQNVANVFTDYSKTILHVMVHTDGAGRAVYNQRLSDERARALVGYLASYGVPRIRIWPSGRGAREPIASNETTAGRRRNRRVDIIVKPIVRGLESNAYRTPRPVIPPLAVEP